VDVLVAVSVNNDMATGKLFHAAVGNTGTPPTSLPAPLPVSQDGSRHYGSPNLSVDTLGDGMYYLECAFHLNMFV